MQMYSILRQYGVDAVLDVWYGATHTDLIVELPSLGMDPLSARLQMIIATNVPRTHHELASSKCVPPTQDPPPNTLVNPANRYRGADGDTTIHNTKSDAVPVTTRLQSRLLTPPPVDSTHCDITLPQQHSLPCGIWDTTEAAKDINVNYIDTFEFSRTCRVRRSTIPSVLVYLGRLINPF
uniref:Regulator of chromosome condensation n=1 Tax=Lygus hesperus TaxID=30085 RepID=A0A0A9YB92_LYGHE